MDIKNTIKEIIENKKAAKIHPAKATLSEVSLITGIGHEALKPPIREMIIAKELKWQRSINDTIFYFEED